MPERPSIPGEYSVLYVATDLEWWGTSRPEPNQDAICEPCGFRRLDPEYYAWLRHVMEKARRRHAAGRLPDEQFELAKARFNAVHEWALHRLGEAELISAVGRLDPKRYRPPQVVPYVPAPEHLYPRDGDWRFTHRVSREAVAKVDAIRDQALSLGWTEAGLYQNRGRLRFPAGEDYGVVCFVRATDEITEVTARSVEVTHHRGSRGRVYNRAVPQPWVRPVAEEQAP